MSPLAPPARPPTTLGDYARAVLNILEDFADEKVRMADIQRAILNILEDFGGEKVRLEDTQRAVLNILEDFDVERSRTEAANLDLRGAFDSLRRAKEAAEAANRELEAFSYSVSHDLRAPLRAIDGFSQALLEDHHDRLDEQGRDYLKRVRAATQRMARLIDDLLKLSRLTRGDLTIALVDVSALARSVAAELQKSHPQRQVALTIAPKLTARTDPHLLKVVIENILDNAWKFTSKREQAAIEVGAQPSNGTTAYFVRDNGAGFDMAYADKLFATFHRLHSDREFPGTGIGLSLVQRVVRRLGGQVWGEGEVDRGAAFYFTLGDDSQEVVGL